MREYFILITPDNFVKGIATDNADLNFYYSALECRSIEIVRPFGYTADGQQVMIIDEEGRLKERPRVNPIASIIANQMLYGNVMIAIEGERNGEPDIIGFDKVHAGIAMAAIRITLESSGLFSLDKHTESDDEP